MSEYSKPWFHGYHCLLMWQTGYSLQCPDWRECCEAEENTESRGDRQDMGTTDFKRTKENLIQIWHRIHYGFWFFFSVKVSMNEETREKISNKGKCISCAPTLQTQIFSCVLPVQLTPYWWVRTICQRKKISTTLLIVFLKAIKLRTILRLIKSP